LTTRFTLSSMGSVSVAEHLTTALRRGVDVLLLRAASASMCRLPSNANQANSPVNGRRHKGRGQRDVAHQRAVRLPAWWRPRLADPDLDWLRRLDTDSRGGRAARRARRPGRTPPPHGLRRGFAFPGRYAPALRARRNRVFCHHTCLGANIRSTQFLRGRQFVSTGRVDASSTGGVDELAVLVIGRGRRYHPPARRAGVPPGHRSLCGQRLPAVGRRDGRSRRRFGRRPAVRRHHLVRRRVVRPRRRRPIVVRRHRQRERPVWRRSWPGRDAGGSCTTGGPGSGSTCGGMKGNLFIGRVIRGSSTGVPYGTGGPRHGLVPTGYVPLGIAAELNRGCPLARNSWHG